MDWIENCSLTFKRISLKVLFTVRSKQKRFKDAIRNSPCTLREKNLKMQLEILFFFYGMNKTNRIMTVRQEASWV